MGDVVLHLGAHGTDRGLIAGWLLRNVQALARLGVQTVPAGRFLDALSPGSPPLAGTGRRDDPLSDLCRGFRRLAVSAPSLLGAEDAALAPEGFYAAQPERAITRLRRVLPADSALTLCLAVGSARMLLPPLLRAAGRAERPPEALLDAFGADGLPWAALVARLRAAAPDARITVWRHEDLPRIWPQVLAQIAGTLQDLPVEGAGEFALLGHTEEAQQRMRRYLAAKPPPTIALMRRVADAFAAGYGLAEVKPPPALGELPVALQARLARLDEGYQAEMARIAEIGGVSVLGQDVTMSG